MKGKWIGFGAVISATLASLCCLGPLVLVGLGLGGVGLAAGMVKYRPLFLGLTAVLLSLAFYMIYRKREVACADGRCEFRSGSKTMKGALWVITITAVGLASFPQWSRLLLSAPSASVAGESQIVHLKIAGMHCAACAIGIEKSLKQVSGVRAASVDYDQRKAVVQVQPGLILAEDMMKAVQAAGPYTAEIKD